MDFKDTPEQAAFRKQVREFLETEMPAIFGRRGEEGEGDVERGMFARPQPGTPLWKWREKLVERGWIAPAWPKEYGGAGLTTMEQFILNEEFAEHEAPQLGGFGVMMIGPTLIVHGSEEQKREHLPGIIKGEVLWCQGWSEPNAGSDVASLQTRAVRDGDEYVINGQKIWTTGAQYADWMYMLARTDPDAPKHRGISYFLIDMKSPGITVRPLTTMTGSQTFNEVFFENVRVPVKNRVGEENRGWYIGTTTLDFERSGIGNAVGIRKQLERMINFARKYPTVAVNAHKQNWQMAFADRWIEAMVAKLFSYRVVTMQAQGLIPNHEASASKLFTSELQQRIAALSVKMLGLYGEIFAKTPASRGYDGRFTYNYVNSVSATIAGGTSEIQRNIIAQRGLGLPRN
jgi:alkylation response protein AidB-like acyl-CoA dehydrogenase